MKPTSFGKSCEHCGTSFKAYTPTTRQSFRFCSQACYHTHSRTLTQKQCERCNRTFRPAVRTRKYCSRQCAFVAPDPDLLRRMYEMELKSIRDISNELNVGWGKVRFCLIKGGVKLRTELAASMKGGIPHNYINGSSTTRRRTNLNRKAERGWRKAVFERDDYTCKECGMRGTYIEADHIKPYVLHPELRYTVANGQTLCRPCHRLKTAHDAKSYWVNQYTSAHRRLITTHPDFRRGSGS